jgi:UDPglucose--hexose-1-phosphate uridylyltransferase
MTVPEIKNIVDEWARQYKDLGSRSDINHVQIFENKARNSRCFLPLVFIT